MIDDEIEDRWNVDHQEDEDMSDVPSPSTVGRVRHRLPQHRQHELAGRKDTSCSDRSLPRQPDRKFVKDNGGLVRYAPEDKNKANLFASFAKSVLSWDSNNGASAAIHEQDSRSTLSAKEQIATTQKKGGRKNEGQEVELIAIMESMSVDDDPRNQQQGDRKKMRMTSDKSLVTSDRELRTQPQGQIKEVEREVDWSSKVGGCHSWLKDNLNAFSMFKEEKKVGIGISPVNSLDVDAVSFCGTDIYSCAGSVGGASLCNIFDSDMALGEDAPIPLTHIAGNIQSVTVKNTMSERILSQRKYMDHGEMGLLSSTFSQDSLPMSDIASSSVTELAFPDSKPDTIVSVSREKSDVSFTTSNFTYS